MARSQTWRSLPKEFDAVIETPLRSNVKYELDKSSGIIRMGRSPLFSCFLSRQSRLHSKNTCGQSRSSRRFGSLPGTRCSAHIIHAGAIGLMPMIDSGALLQGSVAGAGNRMPHLRIHGSRRPLRINRVHRREIHNAFYDLDMSF